MKVLLINGSPNEEGCTNNALSIVSRTLEERGIETEIFHIGKKSAGGCIACGKCSEQGRCVFDDSVNAALDKAEDADGLIFGSPVHFGSPSGSMVGFMDRFFTAGDFSYKPAAVVSSTRRAGSSAALDVLAKYPAYNQMPIVSADYWPLIHGNTPEETEQDAEGVHTLEVLGKNMAWMLKCIDAGEKAGIVPEKGEKTAWTNFVR